MKLIGYIINACEGVTTKAKVLEINGKYMLEIVQGTQLNDIPPDEVIRLAFHKRSIEWIN